MRDSNKFKVPFFILALIGAILIFFMLAGLFKKDDTPLTPLSPEQESSSASQDKVKTNLPVTEGSTDNTLPQNLFSKPFTFGTLSFQPETTLSSSMMFEERLSRIVGATKNYYAFLTDTNDLYLYQNGEKIGISETINTYDFDEANGVVYFSKNFGYAEKIYRFDPKTHDQTEMYEIAGHKLSHLEGENDIVAFTYYPFQYGQTGMPSSFETKWIRYLGADTLHRLHEVTITGTNAHPAFSFDGTTAQTYLLRPGQSILSHSFSLRTNTQQDSNFSLAVTGPWDLQAHIVDGPGVTAIYDPAKQQVNLNGNVLSLSCGVNSIQFINKRYALILESCLKLSIYDMHTQELKMIREGARGVWTDGKRIVYQEGNQLYQVKWKNVKEKTN